MTLIGQNTLGQSGMPTLGVLEMDSKMNQASPEQAGNMLRIAAEKIQQFEVMDIYDIRYLSKEKNLTIQGCYGKLCLVDVGTVLGADKMLTGSINKIGESIVIQLRTIDVKSSSIEKSIIREYAHAPQNLQLMIEFSLREMYGLENSTAVTEALQFVHKVDAPLKTTPKSLLKLDGPRMGFTLLTGESKDIFKSKEELGGYDAAPIMFQFGYQFEKQYINEGNFQALFEFIPMITGLDQGVIIPSLTVMNGLRDNKGGWEFAFGPTLSFVKKARGYYDGNEDWQLESDWSDTTQANPFTITRRLDSRGKIDLSAAFVFAVGKSFKTGNLNIPVNFYLIPSKTGLRTGISVGFNARKKEIYAQ